MIVRFFHTIPGEGRISMEVYARELARALRSLPDANVEITHCQPRAEVRRAIRHFQYLHRLGLGRLGGYVDRYLSYQWRARSQGADVNHIVDHGYSHLAFSLDPAKTVVTFHDAMLLRLQAGDLPVKGHPLVPLMGHRLSLIAVGRVARVITDSESSKRDLLRFTGYPEARTCVVPLGVSARFGPVPHARLRSGITGAGPARILHVGHCAEYKNIEGILRALPGIRRALGRPVVFTKVGGPFTRGQQDLIAELGLAKHIEHLGAVPPADLPRVYCECDVLLMPSLHEGFGLPVLEAMACGTPVVTSNKGSLPEVVGDAGVMVEPTDTAAIERAVCRVLSDPDYAAKLRERGFDRAAQFTWTQTARRTLDVYRAVCEDTR